MEKIPRNILINGRNLRKNPTVWEIRLWLHLRHKNLGARFNRQVYIGGYLADFCCKDKKLIIEIDGGYHKTDFGKVQDRVRSTFLRKTGYKILRFWNGEIDKDINQVLEKIIKALSSTPPPTPPLVRGGEF